MVVPGRSSNVVGDILLGQLWDTGANGARAPDEAAASQRAKLVRTKCSQNSLVQTNELYVHTYIRRNYEDKL